MTTIENPAQSRVQAIFLKGHLKLQSKGLKARGVTQKMLFEKTSAITGKKYKRTQFEEAIADLQNIIDGEE